MVHVRVRLAEDLFPCCVGRDGGGADGLAVGAGWLGCYGSPAVHVAWYWIEMGVGVHGEPGAYIVVTLVSPVRKDFIDGVSWMLLECWGQVPELA